MSYDRVYCAKCGEEYNQAPGRPKHNCIPRQLQFQNYLDWLADNTNEGNTPDVSFTSYLNINGQVLQPTNIN